MSKDNHPAHLPPIDISQIIDYEPPVEELKKAGLQDKHISFLKCLATQAGNISGACRSVHISRQTLYRWRNENDRFNEELEMVREAEIDWGEGCLKQSMYEGNVVAINFYLSTIGRKRGYIKSYDENLDRDKESDEQSDVATYLKRGQARVERLAAVDPSVVSEQ